MVSTIHPSAVLRAPDQDARQSAYAGFVSDLTTAGKAARPGTAGSAAGR